MCNVGLNNNTQFVESKKESSMKKISQNRPLLYVHACLNDNNVGPWESLRWVHENRKWRRSFKSSISDGDYLTLQDSENEVYDRFSPENSGVYFRIIEDAGHAGPRTLLEAHKEKAIEISFLQMATHHDQRIY